jgi:hypothetical protein
VTGLSPPVLPRWRKSDEASTPASRHRSPEASAPAEAAAGAQDGDHEDPSTPVHGGAATLEAELPEAVVEAADLSSQQDSSQVWGFSSQQQPAIFGRPGALVRQPWRIPHEDTYSPDTSLDATDVGGLVIRAVSLRGAAHRYLGEPRQDSFALARHSDDEWLLAAVCDGVGSASRSHRGAMLAATTAVGAAARHLEQSSGDAAEALLAATRESAAAIEQEAERLEESPRNYATTLTLAFVRTEPVEAGFPYVVVAVGDSPSMQLGHAGPVQELRPSGAADLHATATASLPTDLSTISAIEGVLSPGAALILATDGFSVPVLNTEVGTQIADQWRQPPGVPDFLVQAQFAARSFDDDRTVVAVWAGSDDEGMS